jgi:hypothetical protein
MINIQNKEQEECLVMVVDMSGRVYCETYMQPNDNLTLDIKELFSGIYNLVFKTATTSRVQQIVKY